MVRLRLHNVSISLDSIGSYNVSERERSAGRRGIAKHWPKEADVTGNVRNKTFVVVGATGRVGPLQRWIRELTIRAFVPLFAKRGER